MTRDTRAAPTPSASDRLERLAQTGLLATSIPFSMAPPRSAYPAGTTFGRKPGPTTSTMGRVTEALSAMQDLHSNQGSGHWGAN